MGFSADWLALRDPADRAARDGALALRAAAAAGPAPLVVDLGCGTGATWRALAPLLPAGARWRFVDNDADLLDLAAATAGPGVEVVQADLADLDALPLDGATLVTASALLDLVPLAWVEGLARRLRGVPFYAALSYDGQMSWTPEDPRDGAVTDAFNRHQHGDKGLGPALGPDAAERAATVLAAAGFSVETASSPWRLDPGMAALQRELTRGIAEAAAGAGAAEAEAWGRARDAGADRSTCLIGHLDLLALPPRQPSEAAHVLR
ncbi:class I SAM-dependent methyltransferase [Roseibacterium sp. SDUM158017]|uniref:class I SAM-dependent methyltransferase n=1 Tax=Roseicyclus salinarum TaxID=3036773 RepID=UPI0024155A27|nr:class I SAM-dependent methyltransferase [Roseibacterium sp. SDUM158017]MDG4648687.1 class I SAM-dependent methyltransferase [Roseibacterium sp. SDUM158017]